MNLYQALLILPIIVSWSVPTFLFKKLTKYFSNVDIMVLYHLIYHIFLIPLIIYAFFSKDKLAQKFIESAKKVPLYLKILVPSLVVVGLISQFCLFELLRTNPVSTLIPIVRGFSTILILVLGVLIFKEQVNWVKVLGVLAVVGGIYMITV